MTAFDDIIHPIILSGGSGTRLWPVSRRDHPKQFIPLLGAQSQFQRTASRHAAAGYAPPLCMINAEHRFIAAEQLAQTGAVPARIILEETPRNTAPAILTAALWLAAHDPRALMLVLPSDHVLEDLSAFEACVRAAVPAARAGALAAFGAPPDRPAVGYGYLELELEETSSHLAPHGETPPRALPLRSFVEKPNLEIATSFLASGRHLWNAGIFLFEAGAVISAFERLASDLPPVCRAALAGAIEDIDFLHLDAKAYAQARDISFDYAVMEPAGMERAIRVVAVPYSGGWSDIGSWDSLLREGAPGPAGVVVAGDVRADDCADSLLHCAPGAPLLAALGVRDLIAVSTRDAVLVAERSRSDEVGELVRRLRTEGRSEVNALPRTHRPWGWYEVLVEGEKFKVKHIMVRPGGRLSLQSHAQRSEHWVVVEGAIRATISGSAQELTPNQSAYVPLGEAHRLENLTDRNAYVIEVQSGDYLGEDDITRHEDAYNRV